MTGVVTGIWQRHGSTVGMEVAGDSKSQQHRHREVPSITLPSSGQGRKHFPLQRAEGLLGKQICCFLLELLTEIL